MRLLVFIFCAITLFFGLQACDNAGGGSVPAKAELETMEDTILYGMGMSVMSTVVDQFNIEEPDMGAIIAGMRDVMDENQKFTNEEFNTIAQGYFQQQQAKIGEDNRAEGQAFLAENAEKEGVITTESGLQYEVIEEGSGESPAPNDQVTVHYEGRTIDGEVFDSSLERGEPISFPVNGVIPGWSEALQLMKPGAKYKLYIPGDLAYGPRGAGADIGPNETLIFDVELISVDGPAENATPPAPGRGGQ